MHAASNKYFIAGPKAPEIIGITVLLRNGCGGCRGRCRGLIGRRFAHCWCRIENRTAFCFRLVVPSDGQAQRHEQRGQHTRGAGQKVRRGAPTPAPPANLPLRRQPPVDEPLLPEDLPRRTPEPCTTAGPERRASSRFGLDLSVRVRPPPPPIPRAPPSLF